MMDLIVRGWEELVARETGPLHARFLLQPLVASMIAVRAGWRDARVRRKFFFWKLVEDSADRPILLGELRRDVGKLFLVATALDIIYQAIVLRWFYPIQTLIVAVLLAILPYLVMRGLANRTLRRFAPAASPAPSDSTLPAESTADEDYPGARSSQISSGTDVSRV